MRDAPNSRASEAVSDEAADVFPAAIQAALDSLPGELRKAMSNVEIVVEDEPPPGRRLLGLYQGIPLTKRTQWYAFALPDKISIYRGPIERRSGGDPAQLAAEVRRVVLHELAHHFGISDERLLELGRY
jgi:predicted Zn-dependent protease with MMP-like domain